MSRTIGTEEWRPAVGFEDHYHVSNHGRVLSLRTGRHLKPYTGAHYPTVTFKVNGQATTKRLHLLVAAAFLGPRPAGSERIDVCHNDNDPSNNTLENLRYDTHRNNQRQMAEDGRGARARTHCKNGHEFTDENTWHHKARGTTQRVCRTCHYARRSAA